MGLQSLLGWVWAHTTMAELMPSIIRVSSVISGCDQAFLHFLAAWLHRKNEPKKKLTRIDREASLSQLSTRILFYGSKKKAVWSISRYVSTERYPTTVSAFFMVLLAEKRSWQNRLEFALFHFFKAAQLTHKYATWKKKSRFFLLYALLCFHFVISVCQKNFKSALK